MGIVMVQSGPQAPRCAQEAKPYLRKAELVLRAAYPYFQVAQSKSCEACEVARPYCTKEVADVTFALVLLFFGGNFAMTIACWQAFRVAGLGVMKKSWGEITESYIVAKTALEKDDNAKDLLSGADVTLGPIELLFAAKEIVSAETEEQRHSSQKRTMLLLKCLDPSQILDAFVGLWIGLLAVLATLRSHFVHCVNIGTIAGQHVAETVAPLVLPRLHELFPQSQKWVDAGLPVVAGGVGMLASLLLFRVVSAFSCALQGSALLLATLSSSPLKKQWLGEKSISDEHLRTAVWIVAFIGLLWQLFGFELPILTMLIKLPLMPVYLLENILMAVSA